METKVRVGVRVRPLQSSERAQCDDSILKYPAPNQIGIRDKSFTYDYVFGPGIMQQKLYSLTAKSLLQPFLQGYNVTIIAYGQTGSGKTYTMGSEIGHTEIGGSGGSIGLIPRFIDDVFAAIQANGGRRDAIVTTSFLEVYGEDVIDLLDETEDCRGGIVKRSSLPIREDASGVFVAGLKEIPVHARAEALQVLRRGTMNRRTAATLMNDTSSRSHAIFTVTLQQMINPEETCRSSSGASESQGGSEEAEGQVIVSKLTFVDLAGSERLKKTGAEGERMKEGIQINVGLLALGSVINALADEQRLAKGIRVHVGYRQSKLTRLLQDALGGNSQTLFLACVSPASSNEHETYSTLTYANRARNIRNKPIKNTDSVKEELRCLRQMAQFLKIQMLRQKFDLEFGLNSRDDVEYMERPEVKSFLEALGSMLHCHLQRVGIEGVDGPTLLLKPLVPATPGGLRSPGPAQWAQESRRSSFFVRQLSRSDATSSASSSPCRSIKSAGPSKLLDFSDTAMADGESLSSRQERGNGDIRAEILAPPTLAGNPEEEMAMLNRLKELQAMEGKLGQESQKHQEELANVDGELAQKEGLLERLKVTLEGYHGMRAHYEGLLKEVQELEAQKDVLQEQLERALVAEANLGPPASASGSAAQLREKLKGVEGQLDRLKVQQKQQANLSRLAERQRKELQSLEDSVMRLKQAKVQMTKRQRETTKRHAEILSQKRREVESLQKADRHLQKRVDRMMLESRGQRALIQRKDQCIKNLKQKSADAERHIVQLLQLQNHAHQPMHRRAAAGVTRAAAAPRIQKKLEAVTMLVEQAIDAQLGESQARRLLNVKRAEYEGLVKELKSQAVALEQMRATDSDDETQIQEAEAKLERLDIALELCRTNMHELQVRLFTFGETSHSSGRDAAGRQAGAEGNAALQAVAALSAGDVGEVVAGLMHGVVEAKERIEELEGERRRRTGEAEGLRTEVTRLQKSFSASARDFEQRVIEMKKQHQEDLITLLRRSAAVGTQGAGEEHREEGAQQAELEEEGVEQRQLEAVVTQNDSLQDQCQRLEQELTARQAQVDELSKRLNYMRLEAQDARLALQATEAACVGQPREWEQSDAMQSLMTLWSQLGTPADAREHHIQQISQACHIAQRELLSTTQSLATDVSRQLDSTIAEIRLLESALGLTRPDPDMAGVQSGLLERLNVAQAWATELRRAAEQRCSKVQEMAAEVKSLWHSLGGEQAQGSQAESASHESLRLLVRVAAEIGRQISQEPQAKLVFEILPGSNMTEEQLNAWESEVRKMRRTRSILTVELQDLLEQAYGAISRLGLDADQLTQIIMYAGVTGLGLQGQDQTRLRQLLSVLTVSHADGTLALANHELPPLYQAIKDARCVKGVLADCEFRREELYALQSTATEAVLESVPPEVKVEVKEMLAGPEPPEEHEQRGNRGSSPEEARHFVHGLCSVLESLQREGHKAKRLLEEFWTALAVEEHERLLPLGASVDRQLATPAVAALQQLRGALEGFRSHATAKALPERWMATFPDQIDEALQKIRVESQMLIALHAEVQRYQQKQGRQEGIIKLNRDIMSLEGKAKQFEADASDRTRLVDRKTTSARLLKEEKFRKESKIRFAKMLDKLKQELEDWERMEGRPFDRSLLGIDIQRSLILSPEGNGRSWVDGRTELMHLHTQAPQPRSRGSSPSAFPQIELEDTPCSDAGPESFLDTASISAPGSQDSDSGNPDPFARVLETPPVPPPAPPQQHSSNPTRPGQLLCLDRLLAADQPSVLDIVRGGGLTAHRPCRRGCLAHAHDAAQPAIKAAPTRIRGGAGAKGSSKVKIEDKRWSDEENQAGNYQPHR